MTELKNKVESILFSAGKKLELAEIAALCRAPELGEVRSVLEELKQDYAQRDGSLMVIEDGTAWKLTVKEDYLQIVRKIVSKTELKKGVMETLAIVAFKAPVLQSQIVKVRTNKAYDHLSELEESGYIAREKKGRTKLIRLSQHFFDYFDVPEEKLKEKFRTVTELEKSIETKEAEIEGTKKDAEQKKEDARLGEQEQKRKLEEEHRKIDEELAKIPEIDLVDEQGAAHKLEFFEEKQKLETYTPEEEKQKEEQPKETLDSLEVYELVNKRKKTKKKTSEEAEKGISEREAEEEGSEREESTEAEGQEKDTGEPVKETEKAAPEEPAEKKAGAETKFKGKGLFAGEMPEDLKEKIENRIREITAPEKKEDEDVSG